MEPPDMNSEENIEASSRMWQLLDCFQGPSTLYRWLAIRNTTSPLFLNRTLKYVSGGKRRRLQSSEEEPTGKFSLSELLTSGLTCEKQCLAKSLAISFGRLHVPNALRCKKDSNRQWEVSILIAGDEQRDIRCTGLEVVSSQTVIGEVSPSAKQRKVDDKDTDRGEHSQASNTIRLSAALLSHHDGFTITMQEATEQHSTSASAGRKQPPTTKNPVLLQSGTLSWGHFVDKYKRFENGNMGAAIEDRSANIYLWPADQHGNVEYLCSVNVVVDISAAVHSTSDGAARHSHTGTRASPRVTEDAKGQGRLKRLLHEARSPAAARTHTPSPRPGSRPSPAKNMKPRYTETDGERVPDGWSRASGGAQRCTGGRSTPYTGTSDAGGTNAGHTASEPDASFTCPDCARTFKSYYAVCAHAKVHAHLHGQLRTILAPGRNVPGPGSELAVEGAITSADAVVVQYELRVEFEGEECRWRPTLSADGRCLWCKQKCSGIQMLLTHLRCSHPRFATTHSKSGAHHVVTFSLQEERYMQASASDAPPPSHRESLPLHEDFVGVHGRRYKSHEQFSTKPGGDNFDDRPSLRAIDTRRLRPSVRQYYTSVGNNADVPDGPDSEDETDTAFVRHIHGERINEFTDVNDAEKFVMKLWSCYVLDHQVLADSHVFALCKAFLHDNTAVLQNYRNNVVLHLGTLYEFGILDRTATHTLVQYANSLLHGTRTKPSPQHPRASKRKFMQGIVEGMHEEAPLDSHSK